MTDQFTKERLYLKAVTPRTMQWYSESFRAFEGAMDSKADIIKRIAELRDRGVKPVSINTYLRAVNAYFRWLHLEHGQPLLKIPKLKEEQKVLATFSDEDVRSLIATKPVGRNQTRAYHLALTALDSGLRINELLTLTRADVDLDNLTLKVHGKGNKERLVPMSLELRRLLFRHLRTHNNSIVFCTKDGRQSMQGNVRRDFQLICQKAGITGVRLSFHTLRHSFAVGYLRRGGNLEFLRRILGHTSLTTTQKYLRSLGVEDLKAVHNGLSLLAR